MKESDEVRRQMFNEILFYTYRISTQFDNINSKDLIENIKQQLLTVMDDKSK